MTPPAKNVFGVHVKPRAHRILTRGFHTTTNNVILNRNWYYYFNRCNTFKGIRLLDEMWSNVSQSVFKSQIVLYLL
jgi:hypothetical protein